VSDRRRPRNPRSAPEPQQFDPLPRRERARKRIEAEQAAPLPPLPPLQGSGRRLTRDEREQLRDRYSERTTPPAPPRPAPKPPKRRSWQAKTVLVGLFAILIGSIGAGRLIGGGGDPTPTVTPTATVAAVAFVPTTPPIAILSPTPSPTLTPTKTPTLTPTVTPSPTPNPAFIGKVICLDPGHGGTDRGFTREADDIAPAMDEADINLALALALKPQLESMGFTVVMTRETDTDVNADFGDANGDELTYDYWKTIDPAKAKRVKDVDELQARIFVCNNANADLLISMHINGFDTPDVSGFETWFSSARSFSDLNKRFATIVFDWLGKEMKAAGYNAHARAVNDDAEANVQVSGDIFDRYVITGPAQPGQIVPSAMPGAIVETLFLSNDEDAAFLASKDGQAAIVRAYANAIAQYFDELTR
jgi:N-acetylmuramoyl-L-alanine amidase